MHISSLPSEYGIGTMGKEANAAAQGPGGADVLADPPGLPDQLRGFSLSVIFQFCRQSLLYRPDTALQGKTAQKRGMRIVFLG